jgi:hypothetical protein
MMIEKENIIEKFIFNISSTKKDLNFSFRGFWQEIFFDDN